MLDCYVQEMMFMIIVICVTRMFDALVHKMSCTRTIMYVYVREPARVYIESTFDIIYVRMSMCSSMEN